MRFPVVPLIGPGIHFQQRSFTENAPPIRARQGDDLIQTLLAPLPPPASCSPHTLPVPLTHFLPRCVITPAVAGTGWRTGPRRERASPGRVRTNATPEGGRLLTSSPHHDDPPAVWSHPIKRREKRHISLGHSVTVETVLART